jgi:hypothetical protein
MLPFSRHASTNVVAASTETGKMRTTVEGVQLFARLTVSSRGMYALDGS